eukprot:6186898-Pleurochrysis_carterae.AAC.4
MGLDGRGKADGVGGLRGREVDEGVGFRRTASLHDRRHPAPTSLAVSPTDRVVYIRGFARALAALFCSDMHREYPPTYPRYVP